MARDYGENWTAPGCPVFAGMLLGCERNAINVSGRPAGSRNDAIDAGDQYIFADDKRRAPDRENRRHLLSARFRREESSHVSSVKRGVERLTYPPSLRQSQTVWQLPRERF